MKIGIFGGSFDPVHIGHIQVAQKIKEKFNLDKIIFIPTFKTPQKEFTVENVNPQIRMKMIKIALKEYNYKNLEVSNIEIKRKGTSYTYDTLIQLKKKYPNDELFLLMGSDRYLTFDSWYKHEMIEEMVNIIVYHRKGYDLKSVDNILYSDEEDYDFSSKQIKENLELNKLPKNVLRYISKHNLYLKEMVFYKLRDKRYDHSLSVATHAKMLAKKNKVSKWKDLYLAGIVHDMFKYKDIEWQKSYIIANTDLEELPPEPALHGYTASIWLEKEYGLKNKKILNAIKYHTTANGNMSKFDKILYVADKISSDRKDDEARITRKLAYQNLDLTFKRILRNTVSKLERKNIKLDKNTQEAYDNYLAKKVKEKKKNGKSKFIKL